jgi:hypothetical protein
VIFAVLCSGNVMIVPKHVMNQPLRPDASSGTVTGMSDTGVAETAVEEAKGVLDSLVRTLGLLRLIFGGLLVYWVRLAWPAVSSLLPGTGNEWVDIVLLACAAALAGQALELVIAFVIMLLDGLLGDSLGYASGLESLLKSHTEKNGGTWDAKRDTRDLAEAFVAGRAPLQFAEIKRLRAKPQIAYSGVVVSLLYATYFRGQASAPVALPKVLYVLGVALFVAGVIGQLDYVKTLRDRLQVILA